jgi:hypothetical protein
MATVAELATRAHVEVGYLLVLQGCPFAFTNRHELAGSGASSWIGTGYGPRRVIEGLDIDGTTLSYGTEMSDGRPDTDDGFTFRILDFERELIEFFRVQTDAIPVGGRLGPKDDPAPTDLIGTSGDNVPIWGAWVNAEAIGPAGERSYYSLLPGGDAAGQDHAAYSGDVQSLAPSYVYASPTHLEGRRVALYRIFRDLDTGEWPDWQDQHDSGESLIWVGSLTNEAEVRDIEWTIKAEGPSSWLRKQLGANRPSEWLPVSGDIALDDTPGQREDLFALWFNYQQVSDAQFEYGGSSYFTASDTLPTTGTAADFRAAINARIATVSAAAGPDITWDTDRNAEASFEDGYVTTRIDDTPPASFIKAASWGCAAHEKAWRAMGFDPIAQKATFFDTAYEIKFLTGEAADIPGLPGAGYFVGYFTSIPVGYATLAEAGSDADNNGKVRKHLAIAPPDIAQVPSKAGFEISLGLGSPVYFEAQTNRAPVEHTLGNSGGACDAQGYIAFRGSYLEAGADAEVSTMFQLAQICWHADAVILGGDTIGLDADDHARVFVARFIDPRFHGVDRSPLKATWAAADLEYCPVNFFGHAFASGDYAHRMLLRLMLSTGTATWTGYDGDGAVLTAGANHPTYLDGLEPFSDAEIADLGLAIPHELIDLPSFGRAAGSLPGGITSALNRCRYAWIGAQDSQELVAAVLAPRGWGLGFNRGRWRLFSRPDTLTDEDVEVVITADDIAGEPDDVETANLRPFTPREAFSVDFSKPLVSEGATDDRDLTMTVRSLDPSSRSRRDNGRDDVDGWGLIPIPLWRGEDPPGDWRPAWGLLFAHIMGGWFNAAHTLITGLPVLPSIARQLGPGSVVRFSSLYAPTREGVYGPTAKLGRVYKVEHDLESRGAKIDVLLQPGDSSDSRHFAPIAMVRDDVATIEERYDAATRTFFCFADAFEVSDSGLQDVAFFAEPAWLGVGGSAKVHGWQWNGRSWAKTFEFTVESVSLVSNSITYTAGSLSGTFGESCYTALVLAPYDDQPASSWPLAFFSVITKSDFTFGAGPTQGFPLV